MANKTKPFWQSSTILINVVPILVFVLDVVLKAEIVQDKDWLLIGTGLLNILNRFRKVEKIDLTLK